MLKEIIDLLESFGWTVEKIEWDGGRQVALRAQLPLPGETTASPVAKT